MKELSRGEVPPKKNETADNAELSTLNVNILDKDFQVACPSGQQDDLLKAARQLDQRMRNIRDSGKVFGLERIAVMAGLNLSHEFLHTKNALEGDDTQTLLKKMDRKLDKALKDNKVIEI